MTGKRILHACTMLYLLLGMTYFYMLSDYHFELWKADVTYYAFAKILDILLILCIIFPLKEVWREWVCIGTFFAVRALWEILAVKDYATASRPSIIFCLFISDILCLVIIILIQIKRNRRW